MKMCEKNWVSTTSRYGAKRVLEFIHQNTSVIPFAIAGLCNLWVGLDVLVVKDETPLACAFFAWAAASGFMCWHYLEL